ncbi:MAG TPA: response regulator [Azospirillum sp.]|nr:response regulator [Azospirillum sp.]
MHNRSAALLGSAALAGLAVAGTVWLACRPAVAYLNGRADRDLGTGIAVLRLAEATGRLVATMPLLERAGSGHARMAAYDGLRPHTQRMAALAEEAGRAGLDRETAEALRRPLSGLAANLEDLDGAVEARIAVDTELHNALLRVPEHHARLLDTLATLADEALLAGPAAAEMLQVRDAIADRARRLAEQLFAVPTAGQAAFRADARALEALLNRLPISAMSAGRSEAARQLMALGLDTGNVFDLRQEQLRLADIVAALSRDSQDKAGEVSQLAERAVDRLRAGVQDARTDGTTLLRAAPAMAGIAAALAAFAGGMHGRSAPVPVSVPASPAPTSLPREETPIGLRILMAEDERMTQIVAAALLRRAGHAVTVVDDGRAALEAIEAQPFDLVLLDLHMPEMDGLEALRRIRALPDRDKAGGRVVLLTASAVPEDVERCRAAGADAVLSKPLRLDALLPVLERRPAEPLPSTDDAPVFDPSALDQMLDALPTGHVARLIGNTLKALGDYHQALTQAWAAGDRAAVGAMAHKMAGVAGVYGCPALHRAAQALEHAIETGTGDPASLVTGLSAAHTPAMEALQRQREALSSLAG